MRQNITHDPSQKQFESYTNFAGGLNTEISNERLRENEFTIFENVDLSGRSSARKRSGRKKVWEKSGNGQGMFFYYRHNQAKPDSVIAISGRLYVRLFDSPIPDQGFNPNSLDDVTEIPITDDGAEFTFQTTQTVEAVQYKTKLYIATGTKLVELFHDGEDWKANTLSPYAPSVMEAIYIGTNALAPNPNAYIADGNQPALDAIGIQPSKRTGTVNQVNTMTAFVNKPSSMTVDYKWEYKKTVESEWILGRDFTSAASGGKTYDFTPDEAENWDVKVTVRDSAVQTTTDTYAMTNFPVNQVEDVQLNTTLPTGGIQTCRKILLHWERLIIYGDNQNPWQAYISDVQNPYYFPSTNTINYNTGKQEPITAFVRFQDMMVVFTKTTIQTLVGKSPADYKRFIIHDGIGCIADWTAKVVGNVILFRSDEGIYRLRPNPYRLETMNVDRVDVNVKSEIPADTDACAMVYDNQYWLAFPSRSVVYRYYYEIGAWVKDTSQRLNIRQFLQYGDDVYNLNSDGVILKHDKTVYRDYDMSYAMDIETKFLDLSASFNYKKLKKLHVMARHYISHSIGYETTVQADAAIALSPEHGEVYIDPSTNTVRWKNTIEPNMKFPAGTTFGAWILGTSPFGDAPLSIQSASVRGKCRRAKVRFRYTGDSSCELYGFGLEFKYKKV